MGLTLSTSAAQGNLSAKLETIAEAGFNSVSIHAPDLTSFHGKPEDVAEMAASLGLKISSLAQFSNFEGLKGAARADALSRLDHKLDLLCRIGADTLLVTSSTDENASGDIDEIVADYAELAAKLAGVNKRAALLALPWAQQIKTELQALEVIEKVASPSLGLALNSAYSLMDGSQPARLRNLPAEKIFHVQLTDGFKLGGKPTLAGSIPQFLPGRGELNLFGFVRILARLGYQGDWSIPHLQSLGGQSSKHYVSDAYRSLVSLLDEVSKSEPALDAPLWGLPPKVYPSGFEFIEFAADEKTGAKLTKVLQALCFRKERQHISKSVELWRQGAINIVVNKETTGFAGDTFKAHGPSVCDMGIRVKDASQTVSRAKALGTPQFSQPVGSGELDIPAIKGVGGNVVHFIDEQSDLHHVWDIEFAAVPKTAATPPAGLRRIDHVAQTMKYSQMQSWLTYYTTTFQMEKAPTFDVADPSGIVLSQAIASPEGEVRMNLNGAGEERTFAGAFLAERFGAGVQHIAFLTDDIFETSEHLSKANFERLPIAPNYYADLKARYSLDDDLVARLQSGNILYDRDGDAEYFQIYSTPFFEGFFIEIVERRGGYQGYGAVNAHVRLAAQTQFQSLSGAA